MQLEIPLAQMSLAEKLQVMELIWADIAKSPEQLPSPGWHRDELIARKQLADEGKLKFQDWDEAIAELRSELRENSAT